LIATNDVFGEGKHYVTIFVTTEIIGENKVAVVSRSLPIMISRPQNKECMKLRTGVDVTQAMEPHKCAKWEWIPWSQMWTWAGEQAKAEKAGTDVKKQMFLPLVNLWREYPELENALLGR
jgi:8-oxo-dGTP diphosphatase